MKEHHTVGDLKDLAQKQQAMIAQQQKQIEALAAGLQKVNTRLEVQAAARPTAANN